MILTKVGKRKEVFLEEVAAFKCVFKQFFFFNLIYFFIEHLLSARHHFRHCGHSGDKTDN